MHLPVLLVLQIFMTASAQSFQNSLSLNVGHLFLCASSQKRQMYWTNAVSSSLVHFVHEDCCSLLFSSFPNRHFLRVSVPAGTRIFGFGLSGVLPSGEKCRFPHARESPYNVGKFLLKI